MTIVSGAFFGRGLTGSNTYQASARYRRSSRARPCACSRCRRGRAWAGAGCVGASCARGADGASSGASRRTPASPRAATSASRDHPPGPGANCGYTSRRAGRRPLRRVALVTRVVAVDLLARQAVEREDGVAGGKHLRAHAAEVDRPSPEHRVIERPGPRDHRQRRDQALVETMPRPPIEQIGGAGPRSGPRSPQDRGAVEVSALGRRGRGLAQRLAVAGGEQERIALAGEIQMPVGALAGRQDLARAEVLHRKRERDLPLVQYSPRFRSASLTSASWALANTSSSVRGRQRIGSSA